MPFFFGALMAVFAGVWLLSEYETLQAEPTALNQIGDFFSVLTSSEEERLQKLEPTTQGLVRQLLAQLQGQGITVFVGQTLRTPAQEQANIDAGKTSGSLVYSWHEIGRAVDLYPTVDGKPDYNATNLDNFRAMHAAAVSLGFRSIAFNDDGSKRIITNSKGHGIWDGGHIEWREPYASIKDAIASEGPAYGITVA